MRGNAAYAGLFARLCAGAYFNRGKILGMLGREEEAQAAYAEAAEAAHGVAPGSYAKALASLKQFDSAQIAAMEEAVRFLKLNAGASAPRVMDPLCLTWHARLKASSQHHQARIGAASLMHGAHASAGSA